MRQLVTRCNRVAVLAVAALSVLAAVAFPAAAQDDAATWSVPLIPDDDDLDVGTAGGALTLTRTGPVLDTLTRPVGTLIGPVHRLAEPTGRVAMRIDQDVPAGSAVETAIRGRTDNGSWTEWTPLDNRTPAALGAAVRAVQARLVLQPGAHGEQPVVRSLHLTALPGPVPTARAAQTAPQRVYATREGLVGRRTANGHVILNRDHFVALPSRRGLSSPGTGDYTVKVCADNGRCEWAPVWDVGPWNTTDDYWNDPGDRQSWRDLPQGTPQAQAAYEHGYNNGHDQFGRRVANPAGIDLADGMFWDGLALRTNSWVTVTYLWGQHGPFGTVRSGMLNVRSGPGADYPSIGLATGNARVLVECAVGGSLVSGLFGKTDRWLRIGPGQYVSAAHVELPDSATSC